MADNIPKLITAGLYPFNQTIPCTDSTELYSILLQNTALYHKSCRTTITKSLGKLCEPDHDDTNRPVKTRRTSDIIPETEISDKQCFFINEGKCPVNDDMHTVWSLDVDYNVKYYADLLGDHAKLAKLAGTDMPSAELKYHTRCYTYYTRKGSKLEKEDTTNGEAFKRAQVFAELFSDIECEATVEVKQTFMLADLVRKYESRLWELGVMEDKERAHASRLKEKLVAAIPGLSWHNDPVTRCVVLVFNNYISSLVLKASAYNLESGAVQQYKVASLACASILKMKLTHIDGTSFTENCQLDSIPQEKLHSQCMWP